MTLEYRKFEMRAYVQQSMPGDPNYMNLEISANSFWERGYEIVRFEYSQLTDGEIDKGLFSHPEDTLLAGGVLTVKEALHRGGYSVPKILDLPESLRKWIGREFWKSTLGDIRELVSQDSSILPVHVKPFEHNKRFKGMVIGEFKDLIRSSALEDDFEVLVQEKVSFVSEWRGYVLRNRIVNVSHYAGDPLVFPDAGKIKEAFADFVDRPISCSMDWGITETGETLLVEVNDGYALGNYGIPGHFYTAMIESRWRELIGLDDNFVGEKLEP